MSQATSSIRPVVGITCDLEPARGTHRVFSYITYAHAVERAGGLPLMLPPIAPLAGALLDRCDAVVLTGGDDPIMEDFASVTDPRVTRVQPERQAFELALLRELDQRPKSPVLGVCLGMQYMALHAGGNLDQFMPSTCATHARHWDAEHEIRLLEPDSALGACLGSSRDSAASVWSKHKQAITDAGAMRTIAVAPDGCIEAIDDPNRPFALGLQWHPERTQSDQTGAAIFRALVRAARAGRDGGTYGEAASACESFTPRVS